MNYRINHVTSYRYSIPVSVCHNVVTLIPRKSESILCHSHRLTVRPVPEICEQRTDVFGNMVRRFSLEENHSQLTITATSRVTVLERVFPEFANSPSCESIVASLADRTDPDWLSVVMFQFDSPRIQRSPEFAAYGETSLTPEKPVLLAVADLTHQIHTEFRYDKQATQVDTPTETAFEGKHGVCQDFAHVAVACLRSVGLPARYVSGYLRTIPPPGKERLVGADQSHAWVSVYCGTQLGWVDFDPTNDCLCKTDHVPIAVGRDYTDVVPIKGVFLGGGEPTLTVSVDVAPD